MALLRFIFLLFSFIGMLAGAGVLVLVVVMMLRCPPLLIVVLLACGLFVGAMRKTGINISSDE